MPARTAVPVLVAALAAGLAGDYLMRAQPGINVLLWLTVVGAAALIIVRQSEELMLKGEGRWLAVPAVFLAGAFVWRNSPLLLVVDFLVLAFTIALMSASSREGTLRSQGVSDCAAAAAAGVLGILFGPLLLLVRDVSWEELPNSSLARPAVAVLRGVLIAVPVLLLFGTLLAAADAVFHQFVLDLFAFDLGRILDHVVVWGWFAWLAAGIIRTLLWGAEPDLSGLEEVFEKVSLGIVEAGTVLGSLVVLFLTFVVIQFRYLFGGASRVESTIDLTYAEYARQGFFELVAVAALLLPLLLLIHWLLRRDDDRSQVVFRGFALALVVLLFVIMGSAFYRMWLYQQEYGLTELRFYVSAFMVWLAATAVWFTATVLRQQRQRFMFGVLVMGYAALICLNVVNADAFIARHNLRHMQETDKYDVGYSVSLSADAVPTLVEAVPELGQQRGERLARELLQRWGKPETQDWRSWNWGRWRAWRVIEENREMLERKGL